MTNGGPSLPEMAELSVRLDPMGLCYSTRAHPGGVQRELGVSRPGAGRETDSDLGRVQMERSPVEGPTDSRSDARFQSGEGVFGCLLCGSRLEPDAGGHLRGRCQ